MLKGEKALKSSKKRLIKFLKEFTFLKQNEIIGWYSICDKC